MRGSGHAVERISHIDGHTLEPCGGQSGDVLELIGKVLDAAVSELIGDFTECHLAIFQKLFCSLNTLANDILFDGDILYRREECAEVVVLQTQFFAQICRVFQFPVPGFTHKFDDRKLQLFNRTSLPVLDELESVLFQRFLDLIHREVAGTAGENDLSQCHAADIQSEFSQLLRHDADTPVTNHVLDIERYRCTGMC